MEHAGMSHDQSGRPAPWHPTEDELVLLFYGDTAPDEEARLAEHVQTCADCQPVWQEIRESLAAVDAAAVPDPPADFERVMWARVQAAIGEPAPHTRWWAPRYWLPAGVLTAALLTLVIGGRLWTPAAPDMPTGPIGPAAEAAQSERALLVAMDGHLERSELLLVEFMNAPPTDAVRLGFERDTADDLVSSGRLYRQTATHTGNLELAAILEDLERVLVEIARGPGALIHEDLDALRARIEEDDLLFKVRVLSGDIRERQRTLATVSEGDP